MWSKNVREFCPSDKTPAAPHPHAVSGVCFIGFEQTEAREAVPVKGVGLTLETSVCERDFPATISSCLRTGYDKSFNSKDFVNIYAISVNLEYLILCWVNGL